MSVTGHMFVGAKAVYGRDGEFCAVNPGTGALLDPPFGAGSSSEVEEACALAWSAFDSFRETAPQLRARFLDAIADGIMELGDELIERAVAESGLFVGRIEGERARTVGQLRFFAEVVRDGSWVDARLDPALVDRKPAPRLDLRQRHIGVGPVAVFGASNFPLAFSVAGGDTASALAAGCPVIVKAHSAHPGTSELVGQAVRAAVMRSGLPPGVFSMLFGSGQRVGTALVADARIKAVGFTGSRNAGMALMRVAAARREPIPVYAEMSSVNPVFLLPAALSARAERLAADFVVSLTIGAGQFCTNPGLVLALHGPDLDRFIAAASTALSGAAAGTMLTPGIHAAYCDGVRKRSANSNVRTVAAGQVCTGPNQCEPVLFATDAASFLADDSLQEELFGAAALIIRCDDLATMRRLGEHLEGQLTATLHLDEGDLASAKFLLPTLERTAGRIVVNGWPTGVEVCHAMVHGGPFPATSDSRTTSVGSLAIRRFVRPVCYQGFPGQLLPEALRDDNPLKLWRRVDGQIGRH